MKKYENDQSNITGFELNLYIKVLRYTLFIDFPDGETTETFT